MSNQIALNHFTDMQSKKHHGWLWPTWNISSISDIHFLHCKLKRVKDARTRGFVSSMCVHVYFQLLVTELFCQRFKLFSKSPNSVISDSLYITGVSPCLFSATFYDRFNIYDLTGEKCKIYQERRWVIYWTKLGMGHKL